MFVHEIPLHVQELAESSVVIEIMMTEELKMTKLWRMMWYFCRRRNFFFGIDAIEVVGDWRLHSVDDDFDNHGAQPCQSGVVDLHATVSFLGCECLWE